MYVRSELSLPLAVRNIQQSHKVCLIASEDEVYSDLVFHGYLVTHAVV